MYPRGEGQFRGHQSRKREGRENSELRGWTGTRQGFFVFDFPGRCSKLDRTLGHRNPAWRARDGAPTYLFFGELAARQYICETVFDRASPIPIRSNSRSAGTRPTPAPTRFAVYEVREETSSRYLSLSSTAYRRAIQGRDRSCRSWQCSDQCDHFATVKTHRGYIRKWIKPRWGSRYLDQIKAVDVEAWLRRLPIARSSRAKIRSILSILFNHACRYELLLQPPKRRLGVGHRRSRSRSRSGLMGCA
jgi:hypothetical protein